MVRAGFLIVLPSFYHHYSAIQNGGKARKRGRPNKISEEKLEGVLDAVDLRTRHFNAVKAEGELDHLLKEAAVETDPNIKNAIAKKAKKDSKKKDVIGRTTLWAYKKKLELVSVSGANVKSVARTKQFEDIKNPMSLCGVLQYLSDIVQPEHYYSSDDVSVLLNGWDKPKVVTTKEAQKFMQDQNLGVSVTEAEQQRRVLTFNVTIAADGTLASAVAKVRDHEFLDYKEEPAVFDVGDGFFVCCCHTSCPEEVVATYIYRKCIQKVAKRRRAEAVDRDLKGLEGAQIQFTQSTHSSSGGGTTDKAPMVVTMEVDEQEVREKHKYCAFSLDGAHPQIAAILKVLNDDQAKKFLYFLYVKYAGGCSLTESPNDRGRCHAIFHLLFSSSDFRYERNPFDPPGHVWQQLKFLLQRHLAKASFDTFWQCLRHFKDFVGKAFSRMNIQSAFQVSGVYPFVPETILTTCPAFCEMSEEDAVFVVDTIPEMAELVRQKGYVPEEDFARIFAARPECPQPSVKESGKPLNEMATNRQRAMIINNEAYLNELAKRKAALQAKMNPATITSSATISAPTTALHLMQLVLEDTAAAEEEEEGIEPAPKRARAAPRTHCAHCRKVYIDEEEDEAWDGCKIGRCKKLFCKSDTCQRKLLQHRAECSRK